MLMIVFKHTLSLTILLRCLHNNLLGPEVDELLHLPMELMNSASEKETQGVEVILGISSKISTLT